MRLASLILIAVLWTGSGLKGQHLSPENKTTRILFLLDASGSMLVKWEGEYRIETAKRLLADLVNDLREEKNLELALRAYGHQYPKEEQNCGDTRLEVPFSPGNHQKIIDRLKKIKPKGTTPLAESLKRSTNDFPHDPKSRNIIIIITDGLESCDGDPCEISLALQKKNIFLKPFIIGIGMDQDFINNFSCLGSFLKAENRESFNKALITAVTQSIVPAKVILEILDQSDKPIETELPVAFYNNFTGNTIEEIIHYLGPNGEPDPLLIDPVIDYNIVVSTIPPVQKTDLHFQGGKTKRIQIKAPTGYLSFKCQGFNAYKNLEVLIRKKGSPKTINVQQFKRKERYLIGSYDIEVLTFPRITFSGVEIKNHQTKTLTIKAPGILTIVDGGSGVGAIYEVVRGKPDVWVGNFYKQGSLNMQPGNYKVIFRSKGSQGSRFTSVKTFTIRPQGSTKIKLY
jgi:Ca-activated chloride channel homolog